MISTQGSDHESSTKAQHEESLSTWAKEEIAFSSSAKLWWPISIGKKEDWEGRAKGVTFTQAASNMEA